MSKPRRSRKSSAAVSTTSLAELRDLALRVGLSAGGAAVGNMAERILRRRRSSVASLLKAAAAGATAALVVAALRPLLVRAGATEVDEPAEELDLPEILLGGAGRGLVYGALLHPLLPGPPALKGLAFGTAEYVLAPLGGASGLLQPLAPWKNVPGLAHLMDPGDSHQLPFVDHLLYGVALGVLYGRGARRGTRGE